MSSNSEHKFATWKNLGSSGLKISNVIIGCMQYGSTDWQSWVEGDEEKVFEILKAAYDAGIRTFDTADVYSNGLSEILLGKFLKKFQIPRERVIIMTKVFFGSDESYGHGEIMLLESLWTEEKKINMMNAKGLSRKHILNAVDQSLRRLDVEYIDIYQIHRLDKSTKPEEIMRALNDVVESGKVRYIGASEMKAVDLVELQHVADKNGWHQFINVQSEYNLLQRSDENELNYYANKHGVGITPFSPLAAGFLAKPLCKSKDDLSTDRAKSQAAFGAIYTEEDSRESDKTIIKRVGEIAEKYNTKRAIVSLAWLIAQGTHPIVGVGKVERVSDLVEATHLELSPEDIEYLAEPYEAKAKKIFP